LVELFVNPSIRRRTGGRVQDNCENFFVIGNVGTRDNGAAQSWPVGRSPARSRLRNRRFFLHFRRTAQ